MAHQARILIVDDEALFLKAWRRVLRQHGYCVEVAISGQEALEKLSTFRADLVLADYRMVGMDGLELLERVRHLAPDTVRVLIGSTYTAEVARSLLGFGELPCEEFIAKPCPNDLLLEHLSRLLRSRRTPGGD